MKKVFVIGGLGHIGLTLASILGKHYKILLMDSNEKARIEFIEEKKAIFFEPNINDLLKENQSNIDLADNWEQIMDCDYVVITIGTHTDEYLNPVLSHVFNLFKNLKPYLSNQTVILRSTMYPGMTKKIEKLFAGTNVKIAFCPERVQSGNMVKELQSLPQIISANSKEALDSAKEFFAPIGVKQKILKDTTSGELAKMMTNAYRYIEFAIANQFFMMSSNVDCDFFEIFDAITDGYPRLKNLPKPGFTGGSCVRGNRKIFIKDGNKNLLTTYYELFEKSSNGLYVLSFNSYLSGINEKRIKSVSKRNYSGKMYNFIFNDKSSFECSADHLIPIKNEGLIELKNAKDIKLTDIIYRFI